jgi:hypothetical protein
MMIDGCHFGGATELAPRTRSDFELRRLISQNYICREHNLRVHEHDVGKTQVAEVQYFGSGGAGAYTKDG